MVASEAALLAQHGHEVQQYTRHNDDVSGVSAAALAAQAVWSRRTVDDFQALVQRWRPDVVHVHNTLPLVSPSIYWAAQQAGVPVVQTLHNFRLMCPQAMFVRDGRVCEDCLGHVPWRGVLRACYRESAAQTAVVAGVTTLHRWAGTYRRKVDRYIALNAFCRDKFVAGGLPPERVVIKPNFVEFREAAGWGGRQGGVYVGRLTGEKGVDLLLAALQRVPAPVPFKVLGGGPLADEVQAAAAQAPEALQYLGLQPQAEVWRHLEQAAFMVVPSIWYEGFPRTIVEAYAAGVPVIASRLGSLAEVVLDGETGLLFKPGDVQDLADKLQWAASNPQAMARMGQAARRLYETLYTPQANLSQLLDVYQSAGSKPSPVR